VLTRFHLPDAARNPLSLLGAALTTATAVVMLALIALDLLGYLQNPYAGLILFVALPLTFLVGLLLIPTGAWWAARRRQRGQPPPGWPVIDLRDPRQRGVAAGVAALTIVNLLIVSLSVYGGVHYMESASFCGQVCHTTMEPQAVAHRAWPHAQVSCTQCHVGPGAGAFVEAKLAGARQLLHTVTGTVPRPVPPPQDLIQPARVACQQCHWPEAQIGERPRVIREFAADEANTERTTTLRLKVGDRFSGIHRHTSLDIEYAEPAPESDTVPLVRVKERGRAVREYAASGPPVGSAQVGRMRAMDCTDCHNRPAHTLAATPERAVDDALATGAIPRQLPYARREAVAAIGAEYDTRAAALDGIARRLQSFYREHQGRDGGLVRQAIDGAQQAWSRNVFPAMRVTWGTYANHLGHTDSPGCFRCHDDRRSGDGKAAISQECELCHSIPE
jgi:hypothetical protein